MLRHIHNPNNCANAITIFLLALGLVFKSKWIEREKYTTMSNQSVASVNYQNKKNLMVYLGLKIK